jgi:peptide subunit release factor 1 (eRF1)
VAGIEPTLLALSQGQVRTLLVNPAAEVPGFRCGSTRRLTADTAGCDGEGPASPVEDLIDEALEEALAQRSQVDVIEAPELKGRIDGLAALLRFKVS